MILLSRGMSRAFLGKTSDRPTKAIASPLGHRMWRPTVSVPLELTPCPRNPPVGVDATIGLWVGLGAGSIGKPVARRRPAPTYLAQP